MAEKREGADVVLPDARFSSLPWRVRAAGASSRGQRGVVVSGGRDGLPISDVSCWGLLEGERERTSFRSISGGEDRVRFPLPMSMSVCET